MARLTETLTGRLNLPKEVLEDVPRLTLTGSGQVLVENHKGLLSYSEELIEIGCGRLHLRVRGSDLLLRAMDREELLIHGKIIAVEVEGT